MKLFIKILLFINTLIVSSYSLANPIDFYKLRQLKEKHRNIEYHSARQYYYNQMIDHSNPGIGTFKQRYFVDESYASNNNAPVFFYICGEGTCEKDELDGAIRHYARKYHAKLVALEHRYYGKSLPVSSFSGEDFIYLTTSQALADLANFQTAVSKSRGWRGVWVAFGGSYPGSLAAYYRLKYPDLVIGALASSAPVMAKEDFYEYDGHVAKVAGPKCLGLIREVVNQVDNALDDPRKLNRIKALFNAKAIDDPLDFVALLADIAAEAIQYGKKEKFCSALEKSANPIDGYANYARELFAEMNVDPVDLTAQGLMSENPEDHIGNGVELRQWYYQTCKEYGYWQTAHPEEGKSSRSKFVNLEYHRDICRRLFNIDTPANVDLVNNTYYFPLFSTSVSNIYFTNGDQDPWSNLSLIKKNGNTTNPNFSYYLIKGSAHCEDLFAPENRDSKSLTLARKKMDDLLGQWLAL